MNQILCIDNKAGQSNSLEMKPIVRFFAVIIILFSLILISEGIYSLCFENKETTGAIGTPMLKTEMNGSTVVINVEYAKGIDKIVYSWNDGSDNILQETGKTKIQETIDLPIGTNSLNLSVIDTDGKMTRYAKEQFVFEEGMDTNKPEITMSKGSTSGNIKIAITEDEKLEKVTYQWNSEDEIEIEITNDKYLEKEIQAKEGQNTLTVKATDKSNNVQTITKTIKGSLRPQVKVGRDGNYLVIKLTDDDGILKMEYDLNGTKNTVNDINQKEYEYRQELTTGENFVTITVYDINGLTTVYKGKCVI